MPNSMSLLASRSMSTSLFIRRKIKKYIRVLPKNKITNFFYTLNKRYIKNKLPQNRRNSDSSGFVYFGATDLLVFLYSLTIRLYKEISFPVMYININRTIIGSDIKSFIISCLFNRKFPVLFLDSRTKYIIHPGLMCYFSYPIMDIVGYYAQTIQLISRRKHVPLP